MKAAWLAKLSSFPVLPATDSAVSRAGKGPSIPGFTETPSFTKPPLKETPNAFSTALGWIVNRAKSWLPFTHTTPNTARPMLLVPELKSWREQVDTYAESPFEKMLFNLRKKPNEQIITKAWAAGIQNPDPMVRDAALSLFKAYLSYTGADQVFQLSAHTQMKLVMFASHLNEGLVGKTLLYEAILKLPVTTLLEFSAALKKDFSGFPVVAQAILLKLLVDARKKLEKESYPNETELKALKKLVKTLVIEFYTTKADDTDQAFQNYDKVRIGFLKIQPVQEAYQKILDEINRRYRLKRRQLDRVRTRKIAEAEEEKLRRIELIYDSVEGDLIQGLREMDVSVDQLLLESNPLSIV